MTSALNTPAAVQVTEPGVYTMPAEDYFADPVPGGSLSCSGAKLLLPPSCPARFRWQIDNPPTPTDAFDFGHAAHRLVLGVGPEIVVIDADNWRTKAAQEAKIAAHAAGLVPLLTEDYERAQAMAAALAEHPMARALFDPATGTPEQSLFWQDDLAGIWRRARLDWLPTARAGRVIVPDYKTCRSADLDSISKALHSYGYACQAAWYSDAVRAVGHADDVAFVFVFQEKSPPYLVTVAEPDAIAIKVGQSLNRKAIDVYCQCVEDGRWPAHADDVALVSLPAWVEQQYEEEMTL